MLIINAAVYFIAANLYWLAGLFGEYDVPVCEARNRYIKDAEGVYCQSIGSKCNRAVNGRFPLNFTYYLVKYFGGENDGLVSTESFPWGERYRLVTVKGKRGISHGDMIDLNRENIPGFDVREFYVNLVAELKQKGF